MEQFFQTIESFLSHQPWWVIALGTAILVTIINKQRNSKGTPSSPIVSIKPLSSTSQTVRGVSFQQTEFSLDPEDTQMLQALIRKGDKIGAIKLLRAKKDLDLVDAKNIIEAMSKIPPQ